MSYKPTEITIQGHTFYFSQERDSSGMTSFVLRLADGVTPTNGTIVFTCAYVTRERAKALATGEARLVAYSLNR